MDKKTGENVDEEGEAVVYQRSNCVDVDMWDDTALIAAYDNAVSLIKNKISLEEDNGSAANLTATTSNKKKKKKKRKNRHFKHGLPNWQVGSRCRAIYTEDGLVYDAIIKSINWKQQQCVVVYVGYGNEEVQTMKNLLPPLDSLPNGYSESLCSASDVESVSASSASMDSSSRQSFPRNASKRHGFRAPDARSKNLPQPHSCDLSFNEQAHTCSPGNVRMQSGASCDFIHSSHNQQHHFDEGHHIGDHMMGMPLIPPPPMPSEEDYVSEKDTLYSMLISWYMSGYHTGYYQGLHQQEHLCKFSGHTASTFKDRKI